MVLSRLKGGLVVVTLRVMDNEVAGLGLRKTATRLGSCPVINSTMTNKDWKKGCMQMQQQGPEVEISDGVVCISSHVTVRARLGRDREKEKET